ncbi:hypothetical protein ACEPAI_3314 [Sanghuangporus weigelae]
MLCALVTYSCDLQNFKEFYLAGEPGDACCCGVQHSGEPRGRIEKIAGVETYIAEPLQGQKSKGVILFYADVWCSMFINNKLIQDFFAAQGFTVAGIDYFFGDPAGASGKTITGAVAHPAFLTETHFQYVKAPLMLSCSEIDHTFPVELRRRAEDILVEKKHVYFFQVFGGVEHGFAVRGDPNVAIQRWAKEESARGIIAWFDRFSK